MPHSPMDSNAFGLYPRSGPPHADLSSHIYPGSGDNSGNRHSSSLPLHSQWTASQYQWLLDCQKFDGPHQMPLAALGIYAPPEESQLTNNYPATQGHEGSGSISNHSSSSAAATMMPHQLPLSLPLTLPPRPHPRIQEPSPSPIPNTHLLNNCPSVLQPVESLHCDNANFIEHNPEYQSLPPPPTRPPPMSTHPSPPYRRSAPIDNRSGTGIAYMRPDAKRSSQACAACRRRKVRCTAVFVPGSPKPGETDPAPMVRSCKRCIKFKLNCTWDEETKKRGRTAKGSSPDGRKEPSSASTSPTAGQIPLRLTIPDASGSGWSIPQIEAQAVNPLQGAGMQYSSTSEIVSPVAMASVSSSLSNSPSALHNGAISPALSETGYSSPSTLSASSQSMSFGYPQLPAQPDSNGAPFQYYHQDVLTNSMSPSSMMHALQALESASMLSREDHALVHAPKLDQNDFPFQDMIGDEIDFSRDMFAGHRAGEANNAVAGVQPFQSTYNNLFRTAHGGMAVYSENDPRRIW